MKLHANAALSPKGRREPCRQVLSARKPGCWTAHPLRGGSRTAPASTPSRWSPRYAVCASPDRLACT